MLHPPKKYYSKGSLRGEMSCKLGRRSDNLKLSFSQQTEIFIFFIFERTSFVGCSCAIVYTRGSPLDDQREANTKLKLWKAQDTENIMLMSRKRVGLLSLLLAFELLCATHAEAFATTTTPMKPSPFSRMLRTQKTTDRQVGISRKDLPFWTTTRGGGGGGGGGRQFSSSSARGVGNVVFDNGPFWQFQGIIAGLNFVGFLISVATGSHVHLDLLGTGAFAAASLPQLLQTGDTLTRIKLSAAAVFTWGTKLAGFLFARALKTGNDARLEETLSTTTGTAGFWIISALWGIVCSLPYTLGTTSSSPGNPLTLKIGTTMYVVGLMTETLADLQKSAFKAANPGKFCNVGLWSISQHPNFFGNLLLWSGIFIMNADSLVEHVASDADLWTKVLSYKRVVIALLGPWFMWNLFSGQANGTITNTVALAEAKYGDDPLFQKYVQEVPKILPNPFLKN